MNTQLWTFKRFLSHYVNNHAMSQYHWWFIKFEFEVWHFWKSSFKSTDDFTEQRKKFSGEVSCPGHYLCLRVCGGLYVLLYVNAHYSWIIYLWTHLLTKIYLCPPPPKINVFGAFTVIYTHACTEQWELLDRHVPSWNQTRQCPGPSSFTPSILSTVCCHIFCTLVVDSCWWFHYLKWPLSTVLKCCLVFLTAKRLWCNLTGEKCVH